MTSPPLIIKMTTMSINVLFFASLREAIGRQQATLSYTAPVDVKTVWSQTTEDLAMPDNTLCAINMEYVKPDAAVSDGDEVAFFPPVTGG